MSSFSVHPRAQEVLSGFSARFSSPPACLARVPGRTELGGNHTDHQGGHVLCGSIDPDLLACAAPNGTSTVRLFSAGTAPAEVDLHELFPHPGEIGPAALIRGVAAALTRQGCALSGFDAVVHSDIPMGAGLSSSAAFEILIGTLFNRFCCGDALTLLQLAKAGQFAEHHYFGKPCGLMDQLACGAGGAVTIDFADPDAPALCRIPYDFSRSGYDLCLVDTGSCHADLSADYAAVFEEMGAVAAFFGKERLCDLSPADFTAAIPALRPLCGDRAVLRAKHFFEEDRRAAAEGEALARGDFETFLRLVNRSGLSSALLLQNSFSPSDPRQQAIPLALVFGREALGGRGAIRVHGGGFGGTVQAFVPHDLLPAFRETMEALFGPGCCRVLALSPHGVQVHSL